METGAVAGNISPEATSPSGNIFAEAMRGLKTGPYGVQVVGGSNPLAPTNKSISYIK